MDAAREHFDRHTKNLLAQYDLETIDRFNDLIARGLVAASMNGPVDEHSEDDDSFYRPESVMASLSFDPQIAMIWLDPLPLGVCQDQPCGHTVLAPRFEEDSHE